MTKLKLINLRNVLTITNIHRKTTDTYMRKNRYFYIYYKKFKNEEQPIKTRNVQVEEKYKMQHIFWIEKKNGLEMKGLNLK